MSCAPPRKGVLWVWYIPPLFHPHPIPCVLSPSHPLCPVWGQADIQPVLNLSSAPFPWGILLKGIILYARTFGSLQGQLSAHLLETMGAAFSILQCCGLLLGLILCTALICFSLNWLWLIKDVSVSHTLLNLLNLGTKQCTETLRERAKSLMAYASVIRPDISNYFCFSGNRICSKTALWKSKTVPVAGAALTDIFSQANWNKWTAASWNPDYSWAAPAPWALGKVTLPRRGPCSQDTVLVEWVSSCCISLFPVSLQRYLRALAGSVVPTQSSWVCCTSKTFWLTSGHEKILLSPMYDAARQVRGTTFPFSWDFPWFEYC